MNSEDSKISEQSSFRFLPLSIGLETLGGIATPLIPRGTPLPTTRSEIFSTAADGQKAIDANILMGESPIAEKNISLGKVRIDGIPNAKRGELEIAVSFIVDKSCNIRLIATIQSSDFKFETELQTPHEYLRAERIKSILDQYNIDKEIDKKSVAIIELENQASKLISEAEDSLKSQMLSANIRSGINQAIADLGLALSERNIELIKTSMIELEAKIIRNRVPFPNTTAQDFSQFFETLFGQSSRSNTKNTGVSHEVISNADTNAQKNRGQEGKESNKKENHQDIKDDSRTEYTNSIRRQIQIHQRRLNILKEQRAAQGLSVDPRIIIEVEDIEAEIRKLRLDLSQ